MLKKLSVAFGVLLALLTTHLFFVPDITAAPIAATVSVTKSMMDEWCGNKYPAVNWQLVNSMWYGPRKGESGYVWMSKSVAVLAGRTTWDWKCVSSLYFYNRQKGWWPGDPNKTQGDLHVRGSVDMNALCRSRYGSKASAFFRDTYMPSSWYCRY